jgi:hypothetical protein
MSCSQQKGTFLGGRSYKIWLIRLENDKTTTLLYNSLTTPTHNGGGGCDGVVSQSCPCPICLQERRMSSIFFVVVNLPWQCGKNVGLFTNFLSY